MKVQRDLVAVFTLSVLGLLPFAGGAPPILAQETAEELYQAGLYQEEVQGDLEQAIDLFERIVEEFPANRSVAANALMHIGMCHEKLGNRDAQRAYQRLIQEYADQISVADRARVRLASLQGLARVGIPARADAGLGISVRRRWQTPALQFWGDPSPNGRYLTFVDRTTGDLAVHDFQTGEDRRVTSGGASSEDSPQQAVASSFSPDGQRIAYGWYREGCEELRVVEVDGGEPRLLYRDESADINPEEWSEDGGQILVNISRHEGGRQLGLVSADDGALRVIKTLPRPETYISESTISPDGRFVLYDWPTGSAAEERDVFVIQTDGGGEHVLVDHPADDRVLGWTPDGRKVLFASDRNGTMGAWLLAVEEGRAVEEPMLVKPDWWRAIPLGFDAQGSYHYGVDARGSEIYLAPFDHETGQLQGLPKLLESRFTGGNHDPAWSPDGRSLAYLSDRSSSVMGLDPSVLVIHSTESEEVRELLPGLADPSRLEWSPDGRSLLSGGADDGGGRGLFRINAKTGEATPLVRWPTDGAVFGAWGRDSGELVLFRLFSGQKGIDDERSRITVLDLESGEEHTLAEGNVYWPSVSEDGQWIVFTCVGDDSLGDLVVMSVAGGAARSLVRFDLEGPEWPLNPVWGPGGGYVYYMLRGESVEDPVRALWRVPIAGGEPEKLRWASEAYLQGAGTRSPVWFHPDGGRVALVHRSRGAEVWVMENIIAAVGQSEGR